jgi:hypothetical protein
MASNRRFAVLVPVAMFAFAALHLAFEHFTGGVQSHHLLARADLPSVSNWFGLLVLPALGGLVALRARAHASSARWAGVPRSMWAALVGAAIYGAVLAISFELGAGTVTNAVFFALFGLALLLPVYRVEYLAGFVLGMMITFGPVLPVLIASVVMGVSLVTRYSGRWLWMKLRAPAMR